MGDDGGAADGGGDNGNDDVGDIADMKENRPGWAKRIEG